ncbi:hypothetical protein C8P64_1081 [Christiangramia gaetbulicola]|uniref:Outer membrane protein with beta-barrel domain n=1 Tax=Christiangramia gaetbulicola TaxID=703340 RepID=A0A2T6AMP5_9FLAO|nr:hypothetical protein [Christiangramia gaetbulicola]PTX45091.1 hypothetical protein C8P64_1081 [Christiangramia gaetbulicola]
MKERKNIDRIYQEKFKDFEREPSDKVWENISNRLDKKEEKKPFIIPLWMKMGSVAAVLAIIVASLLFTNNENPLSGEPEVVFENPDEASDNQDTINTSVSDNSENSDKTSTKEITVDPAKKELEGTENSKSNNRSSSAANSAISSSNTIKNIKEKPDPSELAKPENNNTQQRSTAIADTEAGSSKPIHEKEKSVIKPGANQNKASAIIAQTEETQTQEAKIDSTKTTSILQEENALADIEKEKQAKEEEENAIAENSKRMRLSTFAAPIFYNNVGSGNELSNQFAENGSSSEVTLSYGVKVAYQVSKKLSIRTGISKVNISNNIQDISYSPVARSMGFENINPVEDNLEIMGNSPSENGLPIGTGDLSNSFTAMSFTPGEINQQYGYIEVPLELEFALIDKKFGLNLIGGASSLFLDDNKVDLVSANNRTNLGEATNINSTSFSTNIGLGMDYDISDKFSISVEPIFKYQLNAFSNVDNVRPTNFGIYSGLNFKF